MKWVCMGKRTAQGGGLATFFITEDGEKKGYAFKKVNPFRFARPGSTYEVVMTEEGRFKSATYEGMERSDRVNGWIVIHEALEAEQAQVRMAKKGTQEATLRRLLDPIKMIYNEQTTQAGRRAVLMSVMEAITRP